MSNILKVENLNVSINSKNGETVLVDDVSFSLEMGECLGILGESGSGKSMTCKAIMGLLEREFHITGTADFDGKDLLKLNKEDLRKLRGKEIAMIMQNPMTCFDPLDRIGNQMAEGLLEHNICTKSNVKEKSIEILKQMQINLPEEVLAKYPHQLSGGMLQRVMIGLALAGNPKLLIADEPTTAIDSITQYEIIKEFLKIKNEKRCGIIFISHDLGVIAKVSDKVVVMHNAKLVQRGSMKDVIENPINDYTKELIENKMAVMHKFHAVLEQEV